jgi:hypothetical protein
MKPVLFAACLLGVVLLSPAQTHAQVIVGAPVYTYAAPVYTTPVYAAPAYPAAVYPTTAYYAPVTTQVYYSAPAAVYAAPVQYAYAAPVVVGAPVRVYSYWGRHHAHVYYRW